MSRDLDKVAKEKLKKAKREAKAALKEQNELIKAKKKLERISALEREKTHKERQASRAVELTTILTLYNLKGAFNDGKNVITELEDGNIQDCLVTPGVLF